MKTYQVKIVCYVDIDADNEEEAEEKADDADLFQAYDWSSDVQKEIHYLNEVKS